ncbi:MAG: undecaprenyl-diphosphate phosphatase [Bacteroidales bacterium]|nr:undecaprenyl-diphosphate phosphatase [Bacteroidales bacterium]
MNWIDAFILGLIQGLTEFLPISSSGHLEIGKSLLNLQTEAGMTFTVVVHGATVLSIIIVFANEIGKLFKGLFTFKWNDSNKYLVKIGISMIPVIIVGLLLEDLIEGFFTGNLVLVGAMLIVTALLLGVTYFAKEKDKEISFFHAFIIGIAQAIAVLPGISRSGSTIATSLLIGNKRDEAAKFSFLMVLVPIIAANAKDLMDYSGSSTTASIGALPLIVGFITAFITGLVACKLMLRIVKKGKLIYFAIYCLVVGLIAIIFG